MWSSMVMISEWGSSAAAASSAVVLLLFWHDTVHGMAQAL
jgi:hypothetical protein